MTLVCCALPLFGHNAARSPDRALAIGVTVIVFFAVGLRLCTRQLSFPCLVGLLIVGQLAMHALLEVIVDRPVRAEVWTYHAHLTTLEWMSGSQGLARMLVSHILLDVLVASVLFGVESNVWTWFRLAALRLLVPLPEPALLPVVDTPTVQPVSSAPTFRPLLWVSASGRRGPPAALIA